MIDLKIPGIYEIPNEQYHGLEGISKSGWFELEQSPLEYMWSKTHPQPPSKAMDNGTAAHACILEQKAIEDVAVLQPAEIKVRRGKAWDAFSLANASKIILTAKDWNTISGMVEAVKKHPRYEELLTGGIAEQSFFWKNAEYGFTQKCRPDYLPGKGTITSLKTTGNAREWQFGKVAGDFKYHWSACLEMAGVSICTGALHDKYWLYVVEQEPPHQCVVYEHYPGDIDAAQQQLEILYEHYAWCLEHTEWRGYQDNFLHMPAYATFIPETD